MSAGRWQSLETVRQLLFEKEEKVLGSHIQVQGVTFTVVGVYRSQQDRRGRRGSGECHFHPTPLSTMPSTWGDRVGWMSLLIRRRSRGHRHGGGAPFDESSEEHPPNDRRAFGH